MEAIDTGALAIALLLLSNWIVHGCHALLQPCQCRSNRWNECRVIGHVNDGPAPRRFRSSSGLFGKRDEPDRRDARPDLEDLVEQPVVFASEADGQSFDVDRWAMHRSSSRYTRLLSGTFFSVTTRRILSPVTILVAWSAAVDLYNSVEHVYGLPEIELPLTPFELTAPILGLLLVFRTDRSFDRFSQASEHSWEVTSGFKSVCRELLSFSSGSSPNERDAAYDLVEACAALHGLTTTRYLRGEEAPAAERDAFLDLALGSPPSPAAGEGGGRVEGPIAPSTGLAAISLGMASRLPSLDKQESALVESQLGEIACHLSQCEMMLRTPIPLGYTRYSVRFLWIWLSLLPFALVNEFAGFGAGTWWEDKPQPVLVAAMLFIGFIFLSIEDLAVQVEEPFGVLPLELHQEWLVRNVRQMVAMNRSADASRTPREPRPARSNGMGASVRKKLGLRRRLVHTHEYGRNNGSNNDI